MRNWRLLKISVLAALGKRMIGRDTNGRYDCPWTWNAIIVSCNGFGFLATPVHPLASGIISRRAPPSHGSHRSLEVMPEHGGVLPKVLARRMSAIQGLMATAPKSFGIVLISKLPDAVVRVAQLLHLQQLQLLSHL
jgi:hypothetical protein